MKKQFFSSDLFLNIVRIGVVLSGMCFMGDGCGKNSMTPQEVVSAYAGTWELNSTYYHADSMFVHKAWLTMSKDSTFTCNASFFLREDSLRSQPISGKWSYGTRELDEYITPVDHLYFSSGKLGNSWDVTGNAKDGFMEWRSDMGEILYRWKFQKADSD